MNVEVFSLCDAATADAAGKLNVLGAFDRIWMANAPGIYPQCAVAMRIRFDSIEKGTHKISVAVVDEDGQHVIPSLDAGLEVKFANGQQTVSSNLVLNIQGLQIKKFGTYSIDLGIDGRQEATLPLYIRQIVGNQFKAAA
jgi:hypothetical protein